MSLWKLEILLLALVAISAACYFVARLFANQVDMGRTLIAFVCLLLLATLPPIWLNGQNAWLTAAAALLGMTICFRRMGNDLAVISNVACGLALALYALSYDQTFHQEIMWIILAVFVTAVLHVVVLLMVPVNPQKSS